MLSFCKRLVQPSNLLQHSWSKDQQTIVHAAIKGHCDSELIEFLFEEVSPELQDKHGNTLLNCAIAVGRFDLAHFFLKVCRHTSVY